MNESGKNLFLYVGAIVFLSISFHSGAMDLVQRSSDLRIVELERQLAEKDNQLKTLQLDFGKYLIKEKGLWPSKYDQLTATYNLCKEDWHKQKEYYVQRLNNSEQALKQKHQEKKEMREFLARVYASLIIHFKKCEDAAKLCNETVDEYKKHNKDYRAAIQEYKDKKEQLRVEEVVQKIEWKKSAYKRAFLATLSTLLIYFLWNKYCH